MEEKQTETGQDEDKQRKKGQIRAKKKSEPNRVKTKKWGTVGGLCHYS